MTPEEQRKKYNIIRAALQALAAEQTRTQSQPTSARTQQEPKVVVREQSVEQSSSSMSPMLIAGGTIAVGVVAFVISKGKEPALHLSDNVSLSPFTATFNDNFVAGIKTTIKQNYGTLWANVGSVIDMYSDNKPTSLFSAGYDHKLSDRNTLSFSAFTKHGETIGYGGRVSLNGTF